jgi:hypothetical protein
MKNLFLTVIVLASLSAAGQKIGGFYSGTLYNDSTKMVQKYELALSEYKGKISGYSYVTFVVNDTFYYGIRKIKANIVGDSLVVADDKMIINNFPQAPAKRVGRVLTIPLNGQDSVVVLNGTWKTNQTKVYYSVPGSIQINKSSDSSHSPLINHLKELNIIPSTPYQNTDPVAELREKEKANEKLRLETERKIKEERKKSEAYAKQREKDEVIRLKTEEKEKEQAAEKARAELAAINKQNTEERKKLEAEQKKRTDEEARLRRKEDDDRKKLLAEEKKKLEAEEKLRIEAEAKIHDERIKAEQEQRKLEAALANNPVKIPYEQRANKTQQVVEISGADSLVFAFYDNGVVDGDSISVYLNGKPVISNIRLTTTATKRTVNISGQDEMTLLLVAENMGTIPPNTGLITIRDGEDLYQVNFSADLHTNATITIRRKKK